MLAVLFALFGAVAAVAQEETFMVLQGGTLIDGRGGTPIQDAVVVVRNDASGRSAAAAR